jgi:hypothetical protein
MKQRLLPKWLAIAGVAAATTVGAAIAAQAADLNYRDYGNRQGSAYDDPRYADLYGDGPPPPPPITHQRRYAAPYAEPHPPIPRAPVYREPVPQWGHRQYSEVQPHDYQRSDAYQPPRHRAYSAGPGCLPKDEIRYQLERDGWRDFHEPQIVDQGTAALRARKQGRTFELRVDRCSGDVLTARPLEPRPGPYADYGSRPYRSY